MIDQVIRALLGRSESVFREDLVESWDDLQREIRGTRVLVLGAAGSIGSEFVRHLVGMGPAAVHVVDPAENNLVELVRDLRASASLVPADFKALPIPLGSPELTAFLRAERGYDVVLNFAAVKHVRSEKDPFSLMHMIQTNVLSLRSLVDVLSPASRLFSVSSDKAVNPENAMGASKALMERLLFAYSDTFAVSSARFANVAFSDGSLLHSFSRRVAKHQPLAAPVDVQRFFISSEEAAQLCLLAGFLGDNREIFVPRLDPSVDLKTFAEIAVIYLDSLGLRPDVCSSEEEAKNRAQDSKGSDGTWPCYFFHTDTTGEKLVEEFVSSSELCDWSRFTAVGVVGAEPSSPVTLEAIDELEIIRGKPTWTKEEVIAGLAKAVPDFKHLEKGRNLDERM
jgi:FlaA1/EpsC-like NDP-sugar epimerase